MKQYLIAAIIALSLVSARATDVYWVDKDNHIKQEWHINDGINGWFQSESRERCLEMLDLFQAFADGIAAGKGEKK